MTERLLRVAENLGLRVQWHHNGPQGWYSHRHRTISLRHGLTAVQARCTLAHEIGHATHGDQLTGWKLLDDRMEARADIEAINLLFTDDEYAEAERHVGPHVPGLATHLQVTHEVIETYQRAHPKLRIRPIVA